MKLALAVTATALAAGGAVTVDLTPAGRIAGIEVSQQRVTGSVSLYLPTPGWQGPLISSDTLRDVQVSHTGVGQVVRGVAVLDGEPLAEVLLTLTPADGGLELSCAVTPRRELTAQDAVVRIMLPIETYAGRKYLLQSGGNSREGSFPEALPQPYTFFGDAGFDRLAVAVAADSFLALEPDWETVARVSVQDNRQFGSTDYEVQVYLRNGRDLQPGRTLRGNLRLREIPGTEIRAALERHLAPQRQLKEAMQRQAPTAIRAVSLNTANVPSYGLLELRVDLDATYSNPFDPDDVRLDARITGPDGHELIVPGFFTCPYERSRAGTTERLSPLEGAGWRIRFCPRLPGPHQGRVILADGTGTVEHPFAFTVTPAQHRGFVRVAKTNPIYLEFEDGTPYFAIGENVCWPGPGGTYDYDNYWRRLGDNGANYARLWIGPFDCFTLERVARGLEDHAGLGRIDLEGAWRVDTVLDEAARQGILIMFCIDSFNSLRIREPHAIWSRCPYNRANGGPLASPGEFFTNPTARALFQRRLRYIVARWGHLPTLLSWEFWNEVNIIETYVSEDVTPWHRDMARALRDTDPYDHLITTSWAGTAGDPAIDALPEMDYIQSHQYGAHDAADFMIRICREKIARFGKPHYFGEYGTGTRAEGTLEDVDGIHLHNGLWSGIFGNAAGTAMLWWWDNYVEPRDLYHHFRPVAEFVRGIPFNTLRYTPPDEERIAWRGPPPPARREDLLIEGRHASWSPAPFNEPRTLICRADGVVEGIENLSRLQHGVGNHPTLHNPVTFRVEYPSAGRFVVRVTKVSGHGGAGLRIVLDGQTRFERLFPDEDDHNRDSTAFNGEYGIDVPAGSHTVVVENPGRDWLFLDYILPGYTRRTDPPVRLYSLVAADARAPAPAVLLWARHEAFNWYRHSMGRTEWPVAPTEAIVKGVPEGRFRMEVWDTLSGQTHDGGTVTAAEGSLHIPLPAFQKSIAVKLFPETP
ncbi:MAG: DUF5060 domain-containing protein [Lentisphaeria bacterium]|nr:DUF5060 domain-containing protein [Lentisphaeria bacterium]